VQEVLRMSRRFGSAPTPVDRRGPRGDAMTIEIGDEAPGQTEDLLNLAAIHTMRNRGTVYAVPLGGDARRGASRRNPSLLKLTLSVDRDCERLGDRFDEDDEAVTTLLRRAIEVAHARGRKGGGRPRLP